MPNDTFDADTKLGYLSLYMNYFINQLAKRHTYHLRIITDKEIEFPRNYELTGHDDLMEMSNVGWRKHEKRGWSKPDIECGSIEVRYLWRDEPICPFEKYLQSYAV